MDQQNNEKLIQEYMNAYKSYKHSMSPEYSKKQKTKMYHLRDKLKELKITIPTQMECMSKGVYVPPKNGSRY